MTIDQAVTFLQSLPHVKFVTFKTEKKKTTIYVLFHLGFEELYFDFEEKTTQQQLYKIYQFHLEKTIEQQISYLERDLAICYYIQSLLKNPQKVPVQ